MTGSALSVLERGSIWPRVERGLGGHLIQVFPPGDPHDHLPINIDQ